VSVIIQVIDSRIPGSTDVVDRLICHISGIAAVTPPIKFIRRVSTRNLNNIWASSVHPNVFTVLDLRLAGLVLDFCSPFSDSHEHTPVGTNTDPVQAFLLDLHSGTGYENLVLSRFPQSQNEFSLEKFEVTFAVVNL
jgi:hypothetical protein